MKDNKIKLISVSLSIIICIFVCINIFLTFEINMQNSNFNKLYNKYQHVSRQLIKIKENQKKEAKREKEANYRNIIKEEERAVKIPIITYHRTVAHDIREKYFKNDEWVNDASLMDEQLKYLYDNGWKSIDLDEFYCWYNKDCEFPVKTFVLTIDDGDSEAYYVVLPILKKYNFKATMFAIGSAIPEKTKPLNEPNRQKLGIDIIKQLRKEKSLLSIESHSYDLHHTENDKEVAFIRTEEELINDFKQNEKYNFKYMAYPYGAYNEKMINAISNSKIKMAFIFKKKGYATRANNKYEISRLKVSGYTTMKEFEKMFEYAN